MVKIEKTLNQNKYIELLNEHLLPYAKENLPPEWTFQQDSIPWHKTKKVKNFFQKNSVTVINWPAQSPDFNPLEKLWGIIKAQIKKDKSQKLDGLKKKIETWNKISKGLCLKFI